ncbi:MAG: hypothetical protein WBA89_26490 [Microcoleus sp.]|uniref:hypothetical protein n=1 Tax=Microcoleus sp. TaxID=44472 RepID=UPI003C7964B8
MSVFSLVGDATSTEAAIAAQPASTAANGKYRRQAIYQLQTEDLDWEATTSALDKL